MCLISFGGFRGWESRGCALLARLRRGACLRPGGRHGALERDVAAAVEEVEEAVGGLELLGLADELLGGVELVEDVLAQLLHAVVEAQERVVVVEEGHRPQAPLGCEVGRERNFVSHETFQLEKNFFCVEFAVCSLLNFDIFFPVTKNPFLNLNKHKKSA